MIVTQVSGTESRTKLHKSQHRNVYTINKMDASTQAHNSSLNKITQTLGKSGLQNIMMGQIQKIAKKKKSP